jgi:hypothetical protein
MENKIKKMYRSDYILISTFIVFLWVVLAYVMPVVSGLIGDNSLRMVTLGAGCVAGVSATSALVAVLAHLRKNQTQLYTEDILCSRQK